MEDSVLRRETTRRWRRSPEKQITLHGPTLSVGSESDRKQARSRKEDRAPAEAAELLRSEAAERRAVLGPMPHKIHSQAWIRVEKGRLAWTSRSAVCCAEGVTTLAKPTPKT